MTVFDRALTLRDATVRQEMIPWRAVRLARADWSRRTLLANIRSAQNARLPVVDSKGNVKGVLWNLDVYLDATKSWTSLTREPARLSPDTPVREALVALRDSPAGVGIVEQGGRPIGLITRKDLVEPLVGDLTAW